MRFIVAEVSKNWQEGKEVEPTGPVSVQFEEVVNLNFMRGYRLRTFTMCTTQPTPTSLIETIIAVFEKEDVSGL